jgi:sporulation protein YlmC with PRC-barrel domain
MQHRISSLIGHAIHATDGNVGKVHEFYFDDVTWTIRYMVVETGNWLFGRKVLISTFALGKPDWDSGTLTVNLTCDQVRKSPDIDTEKPVYRQHEVELHEYYEWPLYWEAGYGGTFGISPYPLLVDQPLPKQVVRNDKDDPHLRSTRHVTGYHIHATDGEIGHVEDFIVDDKNWAIGFIIVNTGELFAGKKVLISTKWIKNVNWDDRSVYLDRSRESVSNSPEFDLLKPSLTQFAFELQSHSVQTGQGGHTTLEH